MAPNNQNDNSQTRWKPTPDEIADIVAKHAEWIKTEGKGGRRAELYHADLSGADLHEADLRGARFSDTYLYKADLSGSDLTQADGFRIEDLAGANLAGTILPREIDPLEKLEKAKSILTFANVVFWPLLLLLIISAISLIGATDANLLSRISILSNSISLLQISAVGYFTIMPTILLLLFIILHLRLQSGWKIIAGLPGIFRDKEKLADKIKFGLVSSLIRKNLKATENDSSGSGGLNRLLAVLIFRWLTPLIVIWFWFRYLIIRNWPVSGFHIVLVAIAIILAFYFSYKTGRIIQGDNQKGAGLVSRLIYAAIVIAVTFVCTFGVIESIPPQHGSGFLTIAPKIADGVGYNLFADFSNGQISKKPNSWDNDNSQLILVEGIDLTDLDAPYSDWRHAFLANSNLTFANLNYANLDSADLRGVNFSGAKLKDVSLIGADLSYAQFNSTDLTGANLYGAKLDNVVGMTVNTLRSTNNWLFASFAGAINDSLNLPNNHRENMAAKDLSGYDLFNFDFRGFDLSGYNLTGANLQAANLTGVGIAGTNLYNANLSGAVGIDLEKLQTAQNWLMATYDENQLADFGFPIEHNGNISERNFKQYNLSGLNLAGTDFRKANLRKANLSKAILEEADFQEADMYAVNLSEADLTGAGFKNAILLDTDIRGANLTDVVDLTIDQVRWCVYDSTTIFPEYLKAEAAARLKNK